MNRIILIGNGFDLAHGMKTSYNDFLKDFWQNTIMEVQKCEVGKIFENDDLKIKNIPALWASGFEYSVFKESLKTNKTKIEFKNIFLDKISEKAYIQNWVDIENEYYELLKKSFYDGEDAEYSIKQLNVDFERIKILLEKYLLKIETEFDKTKNNNFPRTRHRIEQKIYSNFNLNDFSQIAFNRKVDIEYNEFLNDLREFARHDIKNLPEKKQALRSAMGTTTDKEKFKNLMLHLDAHVLFDLTPNQTLFLNFNYTFTEHNYEMPKKMSAWSEEKIEETIHIHGSIYTEDNNPIIFGFGDELDEDYAKIERLNNNDYLDNIKSIRYLDTNNYRRLLEFINSDNYQIFIMGHSCGTSDRTLLNTLFENGNCASIKVFYHKKVNDTDNFSDLIKNISRNFNDKALMRDRVVNKTQSEPLN